MPITNPTITASSRHVALVALRDRLFDIHAELAANADDVRRVGFACGRRLNIAGFALRLVLAHLDSEIERERKIDERVSLMRIGLTGGAR